jgi:2,5-dioxopentanoate dehydrogenase
MEHALQLAQQAFPIYQKTSFEKRALFLEAIAEEIMALEDELINRCTAETALPAARITGERARTCNQLKMFAQLLLDGWWVDARIDTAQPARQPVPKPDVRRMLIPIGPVVVFGASNFPLAFSTAGGDTASALAAGCPVIVKSHSSHPGTNDLVAGAIVKAAQRTGMPEGVFSSLHLSHDLAIKLVQHPVTRAVGFTGSREAGMRLFHAAVGRPDPIPVYAEMSAINPVVLLPGALQTQGDKIAAALTASVTLGVGQFCTNPGLILMIENEASQKFLKLFVEQISATTPGTMLNKNIYQAYHKSINHRQQSKAVLVLAKASKEADENRHEAQPVVFTVNAENFLLQNELMEEIFGPSSLVVLCQNENELLTVLQSLSGQLTATVHSVAADEHIVRPLIDIITQKAGRIIYGGYPTGVEVCHSMQHGGPFPSTTDGRSTSVGTSAIDRFVRPVAYQDFPDHLLPAALQNSNPLNILRLIDGKWTHDAIEN